jgi:hypothetical protein
MNLSEVKAILIHGNGYGSVNDHWMPWLSSELEKIGVGVIARDFPEAEIAPMKVWLPFIKELGADERTVIIGHSSGAVAAMRYAESNKILGSVLVGCNYTDLGDEGEKKSGYYVDKWQWDKIKENQRFILQFASSDDPYIPVEEARFISKELDTEYYEYDNMGHFMFEGEFTDLFKALQDNLKSL